MVLEQKEILINTYTTKHQLYEAIYNTPDPQVQFNNLDFGL